jgi:Ser/Thr protein kinase RdoA (MazF antagonist)
MYDDNFAEGESPDAQENQEDLLDLNEVMQAFGIDEWNNLGPLPSAHTSNLNLLVEVQGQRYLLRERPEALLSDGNQDNPHHYAFQRFMREAGIPIPRLWLTPQEKPFVAIGEDYFELQQWVDGEQFSTADPRNLEWVASAGSMLGRIHQASLRYPGEQYRWPSEAHVGAMVQNWLNLARSKADESSIQAVAVALENWVEQWEAVLPSAMIAIGSVRGLPELHIHGDYHALNLRFHGSNVAAVTGWEASRWEKRLFEVAYALFYFSALAWQPEEVLTRPLMKRGLEPERARQFLRAYAEVYPSAPEEAQLLSDALTLIAPIATINGPLEDLFYTQEQFDEALIDDVMERLNWASSLPAWLKRVSRSLEEMWLT